MVAPLIIAAAAVVAGGLKYGGWDASRKAGRQTYADTIDQRNKAKDILAQTDPELLKQLSPDDFDALMNEFSGLSYSPEIQKVIAQASPFEYNKWQDVESKQVADSPEARGIQMQALTDLQRRAEEGIDAETAQDYMKGEMQAGEYSRGREEAIINDLQARGMGGSGIEAALRGQASQAGADRLALSSSERATTNAQQRALAEIQAMQGASSLRASDIGLNQTNADILNNFAMTNAQKKAEINNMNTKLMNDWQDANTAEQRRVEGLNVDERNKAQLTNIDLQSKARGSANKNLETKYGAESNWLNNYYNAGQAQNQAMSDAELGYIKDIQGYGAAKEKNAAAPWLIGADVVGKIGAAYGGGGASEAPAAPAAQSNAPTLTAYNSQNPERDENGYIINKRKT